MKRLSVLMFVLAMAGCRSQAQPSDPFLRTTVPPPGTGQGAAGGSQPYYSPGSGNSSSGSSLPAGNKYSPPGGNFNYQQTSNDHADPGLAATAAQQSADALGAKLTETVNSLDDPPPAFSKPVGSRSVESAVQLTAHAAPIAADDSSDPPPMPDKMSSAAARTSAREIVETGHHQQQASGAGQNVIRIIGTKIVTEPRAIADEQRGAPAQSVSGALQQSTEIASLPAASKWRKKGLSAQSYESPAHFGTITP